MPDQTQGKPSISRRGFLHFLAVAVGLGAASPLLSSCADPTAEEYQVDIVFQQNDIHYSPEILTIPRGATVTWLNKAFYSQSATCDPAKAGKTGEVSLPKGAQAWDSGVLYPGQRYSKQFDTPGTYVYFSMPKLSPTTVGTIIVQ